MLSKIALEEHFMTPGFEEQSKTFLDNMPSKAADRLRRDLSDTGSERLAVMDAAGISVSVLSQTGPGVQAMMSADEAQKEATRANDYLAACIARHPERYRGFAALPMHDPELAAQELRRSVTEHGFVGALVNGHTCGLYYDSEEYDAFWSVLSELAVPLYLHPTNPPATPVGLADYPVLQGATWGWQVETASHALRLLFGGVFDRFPEVRVILGHMGEGLPFIRWRLDSRFAAYPMGIELARAPSSYFGKNLLITTSGVCSHSSLLGAIGEMGEEAVMFSVDYPYEDTATAAMFMDSAPLTAKVAKKVAHNNAAALLKLNDWRNDE